ncbi:Mechanosensitive channel of small conductance-like 10, putative isoform 3 [Hibiscus syriacus]|uniref:Mechanosensitive channel of small conductance-like 10, putative isoform 3 n=1 Tax=Hibiscus syriacus TaxID=106335 RepID=A0A6A2WVA7_HIBSY|nr:Mechanosensitive channel of small conductance-like 10, putative isoform 3 [Hibiscus syriacus]
MKLLVDGLSTISYSFDENTYDEDGELADGEITNEEEAIYAAYQIFRNISRPYSRYFDEDDLLRFMIKEEVELVFPLFEGSHAGKIDRNSLTNWVVYRERKGLTNTLSDTNIVVDQLNKLVKAILTVTVVTFIIWLLWWELQPQECFSHLETSVIWHPSHLVAVTEIENDKKLKMSLHCNHTMNFQDFRESNRRRTDLIIELKRIMEELGIRYDLFPKQGNPNQDTRDRPDATAYRHLI